MILKGLNKRLHNIFFHTHTVTGIVLSVGLFIIFFSGAFALFMDEAYQWENPEARYPSPTNLDIDRAVNNAMAIYPNMDVSNDISVVLPTKYNPELKLYGYLIEPDSSLTRMSTLVNTQDYQAISMEETKTHMIETLYHLHFFDQIPVIGLYLAGFTALFFLFASITGLIIHWKKMLHNFFHLRTKSGWKNLSKDAHVTLGFIGLPFQIIYAVTGSFLGLSILLLAPSVFILFDGDQSEIRGILDPFFKIQVDKKAPKAIQQIKFNDICASIQEKYPEYQINFIRLRNLGTEKAAMSVRIDDYKTLNGTGVIVVDLNNGQVISEKTPRSGKYESMYDIIIRIHYATFGGLWLKVIYFILSLFTCFILISGILLWQAARDNKKYTDKQRRFHHRTTKTFLCICFSLFPAVAILFIANMLVPFDWKDRIYTVDYIFFGSWLLLGLSAFNIQNYRNIFKHYILIGAIASLIIPIVNGMVTSDWIWQALDKKLWSVAVVDLFWLCTGIISFWAYLNSSTSSFFKHRKHEKLEPVPN